MSGQPTEAHSPLEVTEVDGWPMVKCSCDGDQGVRWQSAYWLADHWQGDQASGVAAIHAAIDRQRGAWLDEADTTDARAAGAREALADAWDEALTHVWALNNPASTILTDTESIHPLLTRNDVEQARRENPYRAALAADTATEAGDE